jgi:hypothetical protein
MLREKRPNTRAFCSRAGNIAADAFGLALSLAFMVPGSAPSTAQIAAQRKHAPKPAVSTGTQPADILRK